ncbi:MAG: D-2-hydroxyacid dehydrogenase, partial [Solobacterium sp.]|nr:D-2-hydroxyacid dehydrogenase [Solobacterium sp.]
RTMKKDSILINVGRGSAIDTEALLKLAREGWFRGVYLDVTDPEPLPLNHPLWNTERVYITPHISGGSDSNIIRGRLLDIVSENLKLVSEGKKPLHIVDRKLGY